MADQHLRAGIAENVGDFIRLEVPVDRHRVSTQHHRRVSRFDERVIVTHQNANAITRLDAKLLQTTGDTRGALCNVGMVAPSLAADDALEERRC